MVKTIKMSQTLTKFTYQTNESSDKISIVFLVKIGYCPRIGKIILKRTRL